MLSPVLNKSNIREAHELGRHGTSRFNCWGTTLFSLDIIEEPFWVDLLEITEFIDNKTEEVDSPKSGDILVMFDELDPWCDLSEEEEENCIYEGGLWIVHTAVYLSDKKLFHKRGGNESEIVNLQKVLDSYNYVRYEIRRLKNLA